MRIPLPDFLLGLLLRKAGYPPAVLVTLLLHGTLIFFLLDRDFSRVEIVNVERPQYINATVIQENPQQLRRLDELTRQTQAAEAAERQRRQDAERQRQQDAERQRVERETQAAREREAEARAEEQRRQQELTQQREREAEQARAREEAARQERERQQQLAREEAAREEAMRQAQAQQAAEAASAIATARDRYIGAIRQTISFNWSLPPSARNGMTVVIRIQLVPTGEVVDVRIIQSSGDAGFDRSAEQAVLRAGRFPELQGMDIGLFDRDFRTINLLFRPEDLLR